MKWVVPCSVPLLLTDNDGLLCQVTVKIKLRQDPDSVQVSIIISNFPSHFGVFCFFSFGHLVFLYLNVQNSFKRY